MTRSIDRFLDHITMYRLVLYYLLALLAAAMVLGALGVVPHDPLDIAFSTLVFLGACWATNRIFARVFDVPANSESIYITALILALIVEPVAPADLSGAGTLAFISIWAMASKFMLAVGRKHIFNPAAFGVALSALLLNQPATWWVGGNLPLLPFVVVGGILIVRKLRCFDLVATFIVVDLAVVLGGATPAQYGMVLRETLLSSPLFFFGFVMLTEPLTAPTMRWPRLAFAAMVGALFAPNVHIGPVYLTPELALLAGNLFAFASGPRGRLVLTLERIERSAADTYDYIFRSPRRLAFDAGQYLEWTLGLDRADNRGNRRYFTIASSPTEDAVRLGVKFHPEASAFKRGLAGMAPGDTIHASQLAGSFVLPRDPRTKLAFVAGGVGITPFRSMLQSLIDRGEARSIVLLYGNETEDAIAYGDVLDRARRELGIRTIHAIARNARSGQYPGYIDERLVRAAVPDFRERVFYVSGPQGMVRSIRAMLIRIGVPRRQIKTDFFPGLA